MNEVCSLGIPETMDYEFLDFNYHGKPDLLHVRLQEIIDQSQDYDLIITTYSRCSNVVVGLLSNTEKKFARLLTFSVTVDMLAGG